MGHRCPTQTAAPGLERLRAELDAVTARSESAVLACSALTRTYRDALRRTCAPVLFALLDATKEALAHQLSRREGHFVPEELLDRQLAALQPPDEDEPHVVVPVSQPVEAQVALVTSSTPRACSAEEVREVSPRSGGPSPAGRGPS
ncbi:hypothetical protein [Saccharopolyspora rhizosphaerae]|uniref:hypothetical protein n=1 Tax=Saccharopolyspora rhizosphaerae TaxID=2492662 RepID=UPI0018F42246|nr:hypothetical protein [Saccharopolyspora rhizosphaerae]